MNSILDFLFIGYGAIGWIPIGLLACFLIEKYTRRLTNEINQRSLE